VSFDITTNTGAMVALQSLNQTAQQLSTTQGRRSSAGVNPLTSGAQSGSTQDQAGTGDKTTFSFDSSGGSNAQARLAQLSRDAGLAAESVQITALQTRQQLGTQMLSIANQAPQSLMKLFG
jgi:flagellin-like hook-associated protein FlgL